MLPVGLARSFRSLQAMVDFDGPARNGDVSQEAEELVEETKMH